MDVPFEIQGLARGCHEILILATLSRGAKHGYQIALEIEERSDGFFTFRHGTLYPILHQMEKEGWIDGSWEGRRGGRRRKAYRLTESGRRRLAERTEAWRALDRHLIRYVETADAA